MNVKAETYAHILYVQKFIYKVISDLLIRCNEHDNSKLLSPEIELFEKYTPELANQTYNSTEYKKTLEKMKVAIEHHYARSRHHPEHHKDGIKDMTLIDLIEMLCDWKAASLRQNNGNILKSIEVNQKRFRYSNELKQILLNTIKALED